jgi:hypothetical protein
MYWPALSCTLSTSFQLTSPVPATVAGDVKQWLTAINTALNAYWSSVAAAKAAALSVRSVTDHVCRDINSIQVGSILDTQRRRRDNLPESYVATAWP